MLTSSKLLFYSTISLFISGIFACSGSQKLQSEAFLLQGQIISEADRWEKTIYLMKCENSRSLFSGSDYYVVDSAQIDPTGRFSFTNQNIEDSLIYRLNLLPKGSSELPGGYFEFATGSDNYIFLFLTKQSRIDLKIRGEDVPAFKLTLGDETNKQISKLMELWTPVRKKGGELRRKIQELALQEDSLAAQKTTSMQQEFFQYLDPFLEKTLLFADTTSRSAAAVLALHFHGFPAPNQIMENFLAYEKIITRLKEKEPDLVYPEEMAQELKQFETQLPIGSLAPDIKMPDTSGQIRSLYDIKASLILIDFWASWCAPCRVEIENTLKPLYAKYHAKGFEIFAVSIDKSESAWIKAIQKDKTPWIHVICQVQKKEGCKAKKDYQVKGIPYSVLIDGEGRIIAKGLQGDALSNALEEWFKGN